MNFLGLCFKEDQEGAVADPMMKAERCHMFFDALKEREVRVGSGDCMCDCD